MTKLETNSYLTKLSGILRKCKEVFNQREKGNRNLKESKPIWYNCYNNIEHIVDIQTMALFFLLVPSHTIIADVKLKAP